MKPKSLAARVAANWLTANWLDVPRPQVYRIECARYSPKEQDTFESKGLGLLSNPAAFLHLLKSRGFTVTMFEPAETTIEEDQLMEDRELSDLIFKGYDAFSGGDWDSFGGVAVPDDTDPEDVIGEELDIHKRPLN